LFWRPGLGLDDYAVGLETSLETEHCGLGLEELAHGVGLRVCSLDFGLSVLVFAVFWCSGKPGETNQHQ